MDLNSANLKKLQAWLHHDESVEIYVNGVLAFHANGYVSSYDAFPMTSAGQKALKPGKNVIAVHCQQTSGGQYIDLGFVTAEASR
ncbi:hypothetical protein SDC9_192500 [bioreactor metagenome]|uniref:Uncharacterized protein n=1 Tax=bioreactor metagenome TaxID=1076179 RepID=A0A645IBX5_9ZZZZ